MKIVKAHVEEIIFHCPEGYSSVEEWLERVGRTCYKSEGKIKEGSAEKFLAMIKKKNHNSIFEHVVVSARIIGDRGLMAQITRHRLASFAIQSTRYCDYSKDKFGSEITVVQPEGLDLAQRYLWEETMREIEERYLTLRKMGLSQDIARSVLPIALKTEILVTTNLREWMHILKLRNSDAAHPMIRECSRAISEKLQNRIPIIFE